MCTTAETDADSPSARVLVAAHRGQLHVEALPNGDVLTTLDGVPAEQREIAALRELHTYGILDIVDDQGRDESDVDVETTGWLYLPSELGYRRAAFWARLAPYLGAN